MTDHFFGGEGVPDQNCFEAWTLLAALARDTSRIRLGMLVTRQSCRNPARLAKIAAGVDHISGRRLEFGIGAGWKENEYRAYGYDFPTVGVRAAQLAEALEILSRLWMQERATFVGAHNRVRDARIRAEAASAAAASNLDPVASGRESCASPRGPPTASISPGAGGRLLTRDETGPAIREVDGLQTREA